MSSGAGWALVLKLILSGQTPQKPCERAGVAKSENPCHSAHTCKAVPLCADGHVPGVRPSV